MKYAFRKINIQSPFPTRQCGHSCQTYELDEYHDPLNARVLSFKDENNWIIHYSFDLLAFDLKHRNELQEYLRNHYHDDSIHVITSATHTHYANDVRNPKYVEYLFDLLCKETVKMEYRQIENVSASYQRFHTTAVGKSRISGYEENNEYLCLIRFFSNDLPFCSIICNNVHPTTIKADTHYFTAEYPGYVLRKLEETFTGDFTFLQGAAGDISSRFVRDGQDYEAMTKMADLLIRQISDLINTQVKRIPLKISYQETEIPFEHEFTPIDLSNIRSDLSEREMETIRIGQQERAKLENSQSKIFNRLAEKAVLSILDIACVKLIFFPNEIFSQYMNYLDLDKEMLISYSNGYGPYVLPVDFQYITYEMFTDTLNRKTKEKIIETLKTV